MDLYETLGVARDASAATIKKAYRKLASEHHPDNGGDAELMAQINVAYETLSNPQKRERYDRTGEHGTDPSVETEAENMICGAFDGAIEHCDDYTDAIKVIVDTLTTKHAEVTKAIQAAASKINGVEKKRARIRKKGSGTDLYERVISHKLRTAQQKKAKDEQHLLVIEAAQRIIAQYECQVADTPEVTIRKYRDSLFQFYP